LKSKHLAVCERGNNPSNSKIGAILAESQCIFHSYSRKTFFSEIQTNGREMHAFAAPKDF
jgi:hypothetical protein